MEEETKVAKIEKSIMEWRQDLERVAVIGGTVIGRKVMGRLNTSHQPGCKEGDGCSENIRNKLGKNQRLTNHLFFMDNLKLYGRTEEELESLINVVQVYHQQ